MCGAPGSGSFAQPKPRGCPSSRRIFRRAGSSEDDLRPNRRRRGAEKLKIAALALKLLKSFGFWFTLERDDFSSNRDPALSFCLSMIFSENRYPFSLATNATRLRGDHALACAPPAEVKGHERQKG